MKKILTTIGLLAIATASQAQTNLGGYTYTNNVTILVNVPDQVFADLKVYRKLVGETNITAQQLAKTNSAVMVGTLSPDARRTVNTRKAILMRKIQEADDTMLNKYEAVN